MIEVGCHPSDGGKPTSTNGMRRLQGIDYSNRAIRQMYVTNSIHISQI